MPWCPPYLAGPSAGLEGGGASCASLTMPLSEATQLCRRTQAIRPYELVGERSLHFGRCGKELRQGVSAPGGLHGRGPFGTSSQVLQHPYPALFCNYTTNVCRNVATRPRAAVLYSTPFLHVWATIKQQNGELGIVQCPPPTPAVNALNESTARLTVCQPCLKKSWTRKHKKWMS